MFLANPNVLFCVVPLLRHLTKDCRASELFPRGGGGGGWEGVEDGSTESFLSLALLAPARRPRF